jgi:predicted amidohydrolase
MTVRVGCFQAASVPDDVEENTAVLSRTLLAAKDLGVELVIAPELFITGYNVANPISGYPQSQWLEEVSKLCLEYGVALILGGPEVQGSVVFNSSYFIDDCGRLLDIYRKTHLFGDDERAAFAAGDEMPKVIDFHGIKIAIMICYDVEFPEMVRSAAVRGADLVAVPTAQMVPFTFVAESLIATRAWENQIYVAYANHDAQERGLKYVGRSSICAPDGSQMASCTYGSHLLVADIDPVTVSESQRQNPYLKDRRPELY